VLLCVLFTAERAEETLRGFSLRALRQKSKGAPAPALQFGVSSISYRQQNANIPDVCARRAGHYVVTQQIEKAVRIASFEIIRGVQAQRTCAFDSFSGGYGSGCRAVAVNAIGSATQRRYIPAITPQPLFMLSKQQGNA
jgi:hypothetical protein